MSVNAGGPEEYLSLFFGRTLQVSMLLLLPQVQPLALHMRKLAGRSREAEVMELFTSLRHPSGPAFGSRDAYATFFR